MNSELYDSGQMAMAKSIHNESRIRRLELMMSALCARVGVKFDTTQEDADPQLLECIRLFDEAVQEVRNGNDPGSSGY